MISALSAPPENPFPVRRGPFRNIISRSGESSNPMPLFPNGKWRGSLPNCFFCGIVPWRKRNGKKEGKQSMPIFEYVCNKCGKEFEKLVPSAQTQVSCPECSGTKVTRKLSRFAASVREHGGGCPSKEFCPSASAGCGCGHSGCCHHH